LNEPSKLPPTNRDRPLLEIIEEFGKCLRAGGSDDEIDEWSVYDENLRRLIGWAESEGCFHEGLQPLKEGGREHDLIHDPVSSSWLKFTKPAAFGYVVSFDSGVPALEPALPLEYLDRLELQNQVFADQVEFVGVGGTRSQPRIITRQPDVPGIEASADEISHMMVELLGFTRLPASCSVGYQDSLAFIRRNVRDFDDVAVFDLRPANVVKTEEGLIVPIDSIPVRLTETARRILAC